MATVTAREEKPLRDDRMRGVVAHHDARGPVYGGPPTVAKSRAPMLELVNLSSWSWMAVKSVAQMPSARWPGRRLFEDYSTRRKSRRSAPTGLLIGTAGGSLQGPGIMLTLTGIPKYGTPL